MVQYGIRQATETMQQMTSVERILQYTDLEPVAISMKKINLPANSQNWIYFFGFRTGKKCRRKTTTGLAQNW